MTSQGRSIITAGADTDTGSGVDTDVDSDADPGAEKGRRCGRPFILYLNISGFTVSYYFPCPV